MATLSVDRWAVAALRMGAVSVTLGQTTLSATGTLGAIASGSLSVALAGASLSATSTIEAGSGADYIGNIAVPVIAPDGTFPIVPDFGYGMAIAPEVAVHRFGSANAKIEQRFLLGTGAKRFSIFKARMSPTERNALRVFWEEHKAGYGAFTYNCPGEQGIGTTAYTCRFANEPLSLEQLTDMLCTTGVTLIEIPTTAPEYTITSTLTRFPSAALESALLEQVQELIPLVKIQPKETGYPAIYVSDRRCTVGDQLYQARLLDWDGISQGMSGESDHAQFNFGNADRVMRDLVNDVDLTRAAIEFSIYHVQTGVKLDLWAGEVTDWTLDSGPVFTLSASDGFHELRLPYPTRKISRSCWKNYNDGVTCPYATQSTGLDTTNFPQADASACDLSYDGKNGCLAHGMKHYFGGIIASPQGVRVKDNSTGVWGYGRSTITSTSIVADSVYDQVLPEIYTDDEPYIDKDGNTVTGMPVPAKIAAGREESDFYQALGIIGEGPLELHGGTQRYKLDGQYNHGNPGTDGLRRYSGTDPAGATDYFSLDSAGDVAKDFRDVVDGDTTYRDNFAAGTAFVVIRRNDEKGLQLSYPTEHMMEANVLNGLQGWIWSAPGTRSWGVLTNPIWIVVNMILRAKGLQYAAAATAETLFVVEDAIAAADICDTLVTPMTNTLRRVWIEDDELPKPYGYWDYTTIATETQFKFRGILQEEKPLRDWISEVLNNCLGYFSFDFNRLSLGIRVNSSTVEAFTEGNILFNSLRLSPLKPSFNHLTAVFADSEYQFAGNSMTIFDADHAKLVGGAVSPLYLKANLNLVGTASKSQAARIVTTRLREELGGITQAEWKAARQVRFGTTVLALNTKPGMVCSMTHDDMPSGSGEFRVTGWRLNKDWSIDIDGRTTTDSMYDMTIGPKPEDVQADPVPEELGRSLNVPDQLQDIHMVSGADVKVGCIAKKFNAAIDEAELRYRWARGDSSVESVDLDFTENLALEDDDGPYLILNAVTGLKANHQGINYTITVPEEGTLHYTWRLHNNAGWSAWSCGNWKPIKVTRQAVVQSIDPVDVAPPSSSLAERVMVKAGPTPGTVVVMRDRPEENCDTVLFTHAQIWDGSVGQRYEIDANTGPAVTYYDGSAIAHQFDSTRTRISRVDAGGFSGVEAGMYAYISGLDGQFNIRHTTEYPIAEVTATELVLDSPRVDQYQTLTDIRLKVCKPPWEWATHGYIGRAGHVGQSYWQIQNPDGTYGDKTTRVFESVPIPIGNIALGNVKARMWIHTRYSCDDGGVESVGPVFRYDIVNTPDSGNPSGFGGPTHTLSILTHADDASIPEGCMAFRAQRDTINYQSVVAVEVALHNTATMHGPYKAQRDANPSDVLVDTGATVTVTPQQRVINIALTGGASDGRGTLQGKTMLFHNGTASKPDLNLDGDIIKYHYEDRIELWSGIQKGGTFTYVIVECWWTLNTWEKTFWVPGEMKGNAAGFNFEDTYWQTMPVPILPGTWYAQAYSKNTYGVSDQAAES